MSIRSEELLKSEFGISESVINLCRSAEKDIRDIWKGIEDTRELNQWKVIKAFQKHQVSDSHFVGTTGYGYDDRGRDVLDAVFAEVFQAEDALVRHQIVSGTQALALCLFGNLRPGDELLSVTGKPYDTLEEVIGIRGEGGGSLKEFGISYAQVDLMQDGSVNYAAIPGAIHEKTRLILIQRSRGYGFRPSIHASEMRKLIGFLREQKSDAIIMVDNCYGEFVEDREPIEAGADLAAGSLIKNAGGGLAPTGGYIVGKKKYVERAAYRLTSPGLGKKVGSSLDHNRLLFQGLFMAPHVVAESLKGAVLCAALMKRLGFETSPQPAEKRGDIIQAIKFNNPDSLIAFCQGIQKGSPVDAYVTPEPWDMPGYDSPVIMAAGAFIQGSSIELSADAPIKPPYIAYMQGGLVYEHVKLGVMIALQMMLDQGQLKL